MRDDNVEQSIVSLALPASSQQTETMFYSENRKPRGWKSAKVNQRKSAIELKRPKWVGWPLLNFDDIENQATVKGVIQLHSWESTTSISGFIAWNSAAALRHESK